MVYLILNLDQTVWNKQGLDNKTYELVSEAIFGRTISLVKHPVTGEKDQDFSRHSHFEIWRYKLEQILEAEQVILINNEPLHHLPSPDLISVLVSALGDYGVEYIKQQQKWLQEIRLYLPPETLDDVARNIKAVGVASAGARKMQEFMLAHFKYQATEKRRNIQPSLCAFAEDGNSKLQVLRAALDRYFTVYNQYPSQVVYIGDSMADMSAIQILKGSKTRKGISYKAIGVLTGTSPLQQLVDAGADVVLSSLSDFRSLDILKEILQELSAQEIKR